MQQEHPSPEHLAGYSTGRLDEVAAREVAAHLAACPGCRERLEGLPDDDSFVGLLRSLPPELREWARDVSAAVAPELFGHPRYEVLEERGWGGMGVIYRARHKLLGRDVALKLIRKKLTASPAAVERFHQEVQAVARLEHRNIVQVYDAEEAGGLHFLVMEWVEGTDLAQLVREQGRLPVDTACDYARQAALGRQHAHERGLVHRDVKPSNLMLTTGGVVKILDFGLAILLSDREAEQVMEGKKDRPESSSLTDLGRGMGTPDYVAPEQAVDARLADIRSDIYSLGATLYFLLSGQPPFAEGSTSQRVLAHLVRTPKPLSEVRKDVPPKLVRILNRMTAKDAGQRFQIPAEVVEALTPFASGAASRLLHRRRFLVGAAVAGGLIAGGVGWLLTRGHSARLAGELCCFEGHDGPVQAVAFSPNERLVLSGSDDRTARLWSSDSGAELRRLTGHDGWVTCVTFLPDGEHILTGSVDKSIRLWSVAIGQQVHRLDGHTALVTCLAVSPDGTRALSASDDYSVRLWDLQTGRELHRLEGHTLPVQCVAFSSDGRQGLSGSNDRTIRLWDLVEGRETRRLEGHTHVVKDVMFCPGGREVLSGGYDGTVRLWDLQTGDELRRCDVKSERVFKLGAYQDRQLGGGVIEEGVSIWNVIAEKEVCRLVGHRAAVWAAAFSTDLQLVLTGSVDKTVRLWQLP